MRARENLGGICNFFLASFSQEDKKDHCCDRGSFTVLYRSPVHEDLYLSKKNNLTGIFRFRVGFRARTNALAELSK